MAVEATRAVVTDILTFLYDQGVAVTNGLTSAMIQVSIYTSAPNNYQNYYLNPTNGEWPALFDINRGTPRTAALVINIIASAVIISGWSLRVFSYELILKMGMYNALGWIYYYIGWQVRGFILNFVKYLADALVTVNTDPTLAEAGLSGLVVIAAAIIAWVNFWAVLVILAALAGRLIGLDVLTAYLDPLLAVRALPIQVVSRFGQTTNKFWQFLVIFPLPIGLILSVGFSDLTRQAVTEIGNPAISGIMLVGSQLGSIVVALVFGYGLFTQHQVSATIGVAGLSAKQSGRSLQSGYARQRERVSDFTTNGRPSAPLPAQNFTRGFRGKAAMNGDGQGVLVNPRSWRYGRATRRVGAAINPTSGGNGGSGGGSGGTPTADGGARVSGQQAADFRSVGASGERTASTPSTGGNAGAARTMNDTQQREKRNEQLKRRTERVRNAKQGYKRLSMFDEGRGETDRKDSDE